MRVLVVEPAGRLWGSERALIDLISSAPELEFGVCCPAGAPLVAELERRGVRTFPTIEAEVHRRPRWRRLGAAAGILRAGLAFRPDVVHVNQAGGYRITRAAAWLLGKPVIAHARLFGDAAYLAGCSPDPATLAGIVAISTAVEEELGRYEALARIAVHRIYDTYASAAVSTAHAEAAPRPTRVACVGRVEQIKRQELFLAAASRIDAKCLVVGDGEPDHVAALKARSPANVVWTGLVSDVVPLLRSCAVLACPSDREALGRVIFEAWDAGAVPVVFAGAGGAPEVVVAASGGVIYAEQTPQSLAAALSHALALSPEARALLVANGRAWMRANVSPERYGAAITDVLTKAARR